MSSRVSSRETRSLKSLKLEMDAARVTASRTVARVCLFTRSASVPRSGLASIARIGSSRTSAIAIPRIAVIVVFPTPPLRVRIGTKRVPPSNFLAMRASSALRSRTARESPMFTRWKVTPYSSAGPKPSGAGRLRPFCLISRRSVSASDVSGSEGSMTWGSMSTGPVWTTSMDVVPRETTPGSTVDVAIATATSCAGFFRTGAGSLTSMLRLSGSRVARSALPSLSTSMI